MSIDHPIRNVGVQVERRDDRHLRTDDATHQREQHAFRIVLLGRHGRAVRADIDAVQRQRSGQPALNCSQQLTKEFVLDRSIRLAHRQRDTDRMPWPGGVHRRDKAGRLGQHRRRGPARLGDDIVAFEIGAREKMRLCRGRSEFVALDREAEDCDAGVGSGHGGALDLRLRRASLEWVADRSQSAAVFSGTEFRDGGGTVRLSAAASS